MATREYKPDCGYAWAIVFACFIICFISAGFGRAAGVLYIALIEEYSISREAATTPFSTRFCLKNMAGPLVGILGQKYGVRTVVILGGIVSAIGCAVSSVSPNVTWITLSWGGIHGLGYGLSNIIHVMMINRYFEKRKGIAMGIALTGSCFGSLLLPAILEYCLLNYGLKGTFIMTAGISLHIIPAAMLLRSPSWESKNMAISNQEKSSEKILYNEKIDCDTYKETEIKPVFQYSLTKEQHQNAEKFTDVIKSLGTLIEETKSVCYLGHSYDKIHNSHEQDKHPRTMSDETSSRQATSLRQFDNSVKKERLHLNGCPFSIDRKNSQISIISCPSYLGKLTDTWKLRNTPCILNSHCNIHYDNPLFVIDNESDCCIVANKCNNEIIDCISHINQWNLSENIANNEHMTVDISRETKDCSAAESGHDIKEQQLYYDENLKISQLPRGIIGDNNNLEPNPIIRFLKTNTKPMFLLISVTLALDMFCFISVITIIIDFATDNDLSIDFGKYLLIGFSAADIVGRLGFGVVLDNKWISHSLFAGIMTFLMGFSAFIIPFYKNFLFILLAFSVCGMAQGGCSIMYPILVNEYMEKNEESIALGCINLYGGLLNLPIPAMIGYFRDYVGVYDGVFWTTGCLCMFNGFLWLFEPHFLWVQQRMNRRMYRKSTICTNEKTLKI